MSSYKLVTDRMVDNGIYLEYLWNNVAEVNQNGYVVTCTDILLHSVKIFYDSYFWFP